MRRPDEELNRTKHTERKNSRTSSNEDKVEKQDIMSECEVGHVGTKTWNGTLISLGRWSSSM